MGLGARKHSGSTEAVNETQTSWKTKKLPLVREDRQESLVIARTTVWADSTAIICGFVVHGSCRTAF